LRSDRERLLDILDAVERIEPRLPGVTPPLPATS
jgi:hypothetical protein